VAALHYVDPQRFGDQLSQSMAGSYGVRIVQENVSVAPRAEADEAPRPGIRIIPATGTGPTRS